MIENSVKENDLEILALAKKKNLLTVATYILISP